MKLDLYIDGNEGEGSAQEP